MHPDDEEDKVPMLVEEVQIEEQGDERLEEEAEVKWQQIPPYQLAHFYCNELTHFDEAYLRLVNERYEDKTLLFEQQQEPLCNDAMVSGAEVGGQ